MLLKYFVNDGCLLQKQRHSEAQLDFLSVTDDLLQVISESSSTAVEQPTHVNADTPTVRLIFMVT